jgi:RNA polymerase sigma-32 factor
MNLPALSPESGLRSYLQEIQKFPILQPDEEYRLAKRWADDGDYAAAQALVTSHLRLVAKMASQFKGYGLPMTDLISEGNLGLMHAVKKFDPERGFRLSTYAMWWIKASMQEFILRSWSLVKMGTSSAQKKLFFNLKKIKRRLADADTSKSLSPGEVTQIAGELNVSERDVSDMDTRMRAHDQHINAPLKASDDEGAEWGETLADPRESQESLLGDFEEYSQKRALMCEAMQSLNARERDIIAKRRLSEESITLEDLAQEYGVSRERIRQIEARALEKMTEHVMAAQLQNNAPKALAAA